MARYKQPTQHRMTRRSYANDYTQAGMYHITLRVADGVGHPFGRVAGDVGQPDGSSGAPHVELSELGRMVEHELLHSISAHYPMVEVQDYVVMPEHLHFIVEVHGALRSRNGKAQHLGQVIAGFKKGCNRCYWALTGQGNSDDARQGKPAGTDCGGQMATSGAAFSGRSCPAVFPQGDTAAQGYTAAPTVPFKVPSRQATDRQTLFASGYVDVMPLDSGQLLTQRRYIQANPRSRLLRSTHGLLLRPQRGGIDTALTVPALMGYLARECSESQLTADVHAQLMRRLLISQGLVALDSYGDRRLLGRRLLPVVCHRRDAARFGRQKALCLQAARQGAVLVSARIANGERDIVDSAVEEGHAVVLVAADGMEPLYHPSPSRIDRCLAGRLLIVTPWQHHYRSQETTVSVAECKTMNCVVQAVCRLRDDWWTVAQ